MTTLKLDLRGKLTEVGSRGGRELCSPETLLPGDGAVRGAGGGEQRVKLIPIP